MKVNLTLLLLLLVSSGAQAISLFGLEKAKNPKNALPASPPANLLEPTDAKITQRVHDFNTNKAEEL